MTRCMDVANNVFFVVCFEINSLEINVPINPKNRAIPIVITINIFFFDKSVPVKNFILCLNKIIEFYSLKLKQLIIYYGAF